MLLLVTLFSDSLPFLSNSFLPNVFLSKARLFWFHYKHRFLNRILFVAFWKRELCNFVRKSDIGKLGYSKKISCNFTILWISMRRVLCEIWKVFNYIVFIFFLSFFSDYGKMSLILWFQQILKKLLKKNIK